MNLSLRASRANFFDRAAVLTRVDSATHKALSQAGAYIRRTAKGLIRNARMKIVSEMNDAELAGYRQWVNRYKAGATKAKPRRPLASSKPGEPPRSRVGLLRRFIEFGFDQQTRSVVVGPKKISVRAGSADAPNTLEFGGRAKTSAGWRSNQMALKRRAPVTAQVFRRPYMGPALEKNLPNIPSLWRNSVRA